METLGIFKDVDGAVDAIDSLVKAGFSETDITSITSVPYPDGVLVKTNQRTRFRWMALAGGIFGSCAGFLLAAGTAYLYPVQTGDKPIIAFYPTGIITYEFTMLFAILGTIVGMFVEMGLPPRGNRPNDTAIAEGSIGICVSTASSGESSRAESIMRDTGALRTINEEIPKGSRGR